MTLRSTDYALLAQHSYKNPALDQPIKLDGVTYKAFDHVDNPKTGFQATAYKRVDTGEVVIAFRGTEFDREALHDGGIDAGMVATGANAQAADAEAFTKRVLACNQPLNVTVTGHSLGGTLAELQAHKFGLKGETFNAYGAAGLLHGVPKGGHQVINHVRAGDPVSAASAHFGEVRIYTAQQDIATLSKAGYRDDGGISSARNPFKATDFGAHAVDNFVPDSKTLGHSIIAPENEARYREHRGMIDRYRGDVHASRTVLSASWEIPKAAIQGGQATGQAIRDSASRAIDKITPPRSWLGSEAAPAPLLNQSQHPGNALFKQAQAGMQAIDAKFGRPSDHQTDNAAGLVAVRAQCAGMKCIDLMELGGTSGDKIVAIQGKPGTALSKVIDVPTVEALNTPLAQSSQAFADVHERQQAQRAQSQQQLNQPALTPTGPVLA